MKKILNILILLFVFASAAQAQPAACCPEFKLSTEFITPCDDTTCKSTAGPVGVPGGHALLVACKNQQQTYYVVPGLPGFSYSWTVVGGTILNAYTNPGVITWGNGSTGYIQVIIKNADSTCRDTIRTEVCLLSGPTAGITFSPNPVCLYTPVNFSGITSVGASNYYWDFGDGTYSNLQNPPPHPYTTSGPKTVILTVSTSTSFNGVTRDCGCKDTAMVIINVSGLEGINIYTDDCRKMLCAGDTVKYCTNTPGCTGLTWSVNGGTIYPTGANTGTCVTVIWDQPSTYPTSVTLNANCPNTCGNTATLNVPVLYPNLPIQGPNIVCPGSASTYSLPALPGTFYKWTISGGGGTIVGPDSNHNIINVQWGGFPGGPFVITCNYNNPYSGCSGKDTIHVYIKPKFKLTGISPVCVGQTTAICANGAVATWTYFPTTGFTVMSSPGNCKNIKWDLPGSYTITATPSSPSSYCSSPAVINILALDTPKINAIVGPLVVCPGQTVMYSITSNMNAGTFNWTVTNGTVLQYMGAHNDSLLVQFTGNGTISVSQTVNGCSSYTQTINVSLITGIGTITGTSPACIDAVETYSIAGPVPPGGYTWILSNALGAIINTTANSITVQWNGAGPSSTCTITATACSQTATKVVTVNNPPNGTITATGNLCTTGVILTTSLAMPSHDWYKNGVFYINSGASNTITVTTPGFYKVKSPTPCYGSATINVPNTFTSNVSITANNVTVFCPGDPINVVLVATVQANNTCTYNYQWYNGVTPVGTNSPTYTAIATGSYTVIISCGNCKDTSNVITVSVGPCTGSCDNYNPLKAIGNDIGGPADAITEPETDELFSYGIVINPPVASPCNVVTFNATYNFSAPHSVNSGVFWNFGDGFGATSPTGPPVGTFTSTAPPHTYTTPGIYVVSALMYSNCPPPPTPHICPVLDTMHYVVPVAANFGYNINCNQVTLSDLSTTLPSLGCTISAWAWSVTGPAGAVFNNPAAQNPILTVTQSGTYNITLLVTSNCGGCQATVTYPVIITLPTATFTPPSPICAGTPAPFSVAGPASNSYNWNFGDGYQSNLQSTTHSFAAAGTSQVILTVTDQFGCVVKDTQIVTILPKLTVTIPADKYICPGAGFTLTTTPAVFTNYQWYFNGNAIGGATSPTYYATNIGEYYVIVNNGTGCVATSNKMKIWHHPKPIANIQGQTIQCVTGGTGTVYLYNSISDPNYTYLWTVSPAATFSPNNTQYDANATVNATGTYQFILTVTDITTGCIAKDTFCVYVNNNPTVSIGPIGYLCEGVTHTYLATALPPSPNYIYQWSNGATGVNMSTGVAGNYYVTVLNTLTGCSAQSNTVTIKKRPYVALFPIGCDTLCDTAKLIPPLPLGPGQNYNGVYVINWYVDGNYHSTGPLLNLNVLSLGQHQIYIVVNFIGDTCAATSGKYDLFIKHCGDCDCKESHWGEIQLTEGQKAAAKNNVKANVPKPIILKCNAGQKLDCNKTYTIDASYFCKDTACDKKVTYVLQPGVGSPITGSLPLTFTTPNSNTVYVLTLYGWCGDKICDSCVIDLIVQCDSVDCCKGSVWEATPWYAFEKGSKQKINCNEKEQVIEISGDLCKQKLTFGATIKCPPNCISADSVFVYDAGNNLVQSGPAPLTLNTLADGTYTVEIVGYCGGLPCLKCKIIVKIKCDKKCDCNEKEPIQLSVTGNDKIKQIRCGMDLGRLDCNSTLTIAGTYNCDPKDCPSNLTYTMTGPGGPVTGTLPLTINTGILTNGTYTILIQAYCNGKLCKECKITFTIECERPCCPYKIEATAGTIKYDHVQIPNATIAAQTFTINGLALANITEVRANVVSYTITDNYGKECMKCVNLPFTWASIASAANIGAAPGLITMYGGTGVPSFNGSGTGAYKNPREVIWNNGAPISIPNGTNIGMNFILPPVPAIDCCELKGRICVKFTFRDNDCKECEVIACFDFVIKKK